MVESEKVFKDQDRKNMQSRTTQLHAHEDLLTEGGHF